MLLKGLVLPNYRKFQVKFSKSESSAWKSFPVISICVLAKGSFLRKTNSKSCRVRHTTKETEKFQTHHLTMVDAQKMSPLHPSMFTDVLEGLESAIKYLFAYDIRVVFVCGRAEHFDWGSSLSMPSGGFPSAPSSWLPVVSLATWRPPSAFGSLIPLFQIVLGEIYSHCWNLSFRPISSQWSLLHASIFTVVLEGLESARKSFSSYVIWVVFVCGCCRSQKNLTASK